MPGENSGNMYVKKPTQTQKQDFKDSNLKSSKEIAETMKNTQGCLLKILQKKVPQLFLLIP